MEENMANSNAQRTEEDDGAQSARGTASNRPVATFKQGGVEVSVWRNNEMYNATIRNSYKDDAGNWKETTSFSPADLAVASQLTSQAFQEIVRLKQQERGR
jgi:hypothetical protein